MRLGGQLMLIASALAACAQANTPTGISPPLQARPNYELKFQTELDNSPVIKQTGQLQIFKCQVRLAPVPAGGMQAPGQQQQLARPRLRWSSRPAGGKQASAAAEWLAAAAPSLNVSQLTIDWFKDERAIEPAGRLQVGSIEEFVAAINVTLKSRAERPARANKARIEIKNTLNSGQLKLTSRLRLSHLRAADSGHYKCVARASFARDDELVEQTLESNVTRLVVSGADSPTVATTDKTGRPTESRKKWIATSDATGYRAPPAKGVHYSAGDNQQTAREAQTNQADDMRTSSNLFEDDEDLFRADPPELIDGQPAGANDDSGGDTADGQMIETGFSAPLQDAHSDWNLANGGPAKAAPDSDKFMDNEQMAADDNGKSEADAELDEGDKSHESPLGDNNNSADSVTASRPASGPSGWPAGSLDHRQDGASVTAAAAAAHSKLMARLVHRIAPELGCYTATGELYRGHVASSSDSRACLNWLQVRQALGSGNSAGDRPNSKSANSPDANHNYCRNPSAAQRGPWCFVAYSELLDGPLLMRPANQTGGKFVSRRGRVVRMGARQQLFVSRPCRIASCSEYLWLYVVAPPLGLLLLLTCLASLLVKSIRKSHYKSIFSAAYRRHSNSSSCRPGPARGSPKRGCLIAGNLRKVFKSRFLGSPSGCRRARGHKVTGRQPTSKANYLDDDIFEIVDDIDWSDGQAHSQSLSPKSNESFRLHSASFDSAAGASSGSAAPPNGHQKPPIQSGGRSTLSHSKSITPVFSERALIDVGAPVPPPRLASNMSKSKSQAGPMFATLRCHVRQTQQRRQVDALKQQASEWSSLSLQESSATAMGTQTATPTTISTGDAIKTGHLISCSSSSSSSNNALSSVANGDQDQCILVNELPRLERTNVTISCEVQPIYEGKFSQVQMAYRMQHESDRTQATGRIGAQVAVCALKQQAALDESVFQASRLKVRNLNHLNLLKLIGYVQFDGAASPGDVMTPPSATCGLIYDMAHLIDLSDWLKEQSKEAVIAQRDEISGDLTLRQNLACLSKQIALALDYLHDKNIVYKDLACRNCFLDATRMLVKLASFNIELEFDKNISIGGDQQTNNAGADNLVGAVGDNSKPDSDITGGSASPAAADNDDAMALMASRRSNLKSMVRPKYLLDYYVIDSRPSECQLLPLSWIPLESILFNKFNKQTDIWSFGCLIYELFSLGEVAYFGYSSKQVIDSVRSNMMPPQPLLCPNGIYKLMCKCLSDIPTLRPNIKHIYEQLNLYSGQCSSFLNHHLCTM